MRCTRLVDGPAVALLIGVAVACLPLLHGSPAWAEKPSACVPRGDKDPTYAWDPLHIVQRGDGRESPTPKSFESQKKHQKRQIVVDPVRNLQVAFISGVTLEAPVGSEDWVVVQTRTCPPARWAGAMAYDPVNDEIVLWGGTMSVAGPTDETWIYDPELRDWRRLESGSAELRDLRAKLGTLADELETLRWDLWKTLEWQVTGKSGAAAESALVERLETLARDIAEAEGLAGRAQPALSGYEETQAAGAAKWLAAARAEIGKLGEGIESGTPEELERDYRALVALRTDLLSAVDSVRAAPPSRYFVALEPDPAGEAFALTGTVERELPDRWVYRLGERRWQREDPPPGSAVSPPVPDGEHVLRDAASVAELRQWQERTRAWAERIPANTWVIAPAHGTGRPNWGRSWSSIVYDPDREQLYYRDGGHGSYHGNDTDHYDIRTGRWFRSDVAEEPADRIMGGYFGWGRGYNYAPFAIHTYKWNLFYNPLTDHLQRRVFHAPERPDGNTHDYDPDRGSWSADPVTVKVVGPIVPGVPDGIVSVHGWDRYSGIPSATVGYQTAGGYREWSGTGPIAFHGANHDDDFALFYDPKRNRVMYYGGEDDTLGLFALSLDAERPKWQRLRVSAAGDGRIPRAYREWIYIPRHDMFLTMEWQRDGKGAPRVWSFDPEENLFRPVDLAFGNGVTPGGGATELGGASVSSGLAYDPVSDVAFYIRSASRAPTLFAFRFVPDAR